ncbi:uncharacterized protein A1O5_05370 [Cladophialophora psammophila CBS 110553]|uniref:Xylanolytic transcriptional activator regulatory domain-containing protein n=1 Tax=Cladophialophora psammophila CBS 110553 TaxID=1182543 RepID=W9WTM7_9EURO|nr:uncharacterized protein A1O5_05370 [Cladophialophora psammophila CBS 110553]EXJ71562.1 hypothetical protein A1O5_05370 [Cladophialophora psammophila CBS 110553]
MVQMMGLCSESSNDSNDGSASESFILAEERRRTAWTCFLMESLLSGGGSRTRILTSEDMTIQLPCEDEPFVFGNPVRCEMLSGSFEPQTPPNTVSNLSILAYTVRVADIWGDVAKWASCGDESVNESQGCRESRAHSLVSSLHHWKSTLPDRLRYSLFSLQAHSVLEQGQGFCYMHCIYFMAIIFLHRHYLPHLGLSKGQRHPNRSDHEAFLDWASRSSQTLYDTASTVCDMCEEINRFGADFRRGLVPWIGFTVYTTIGVMLYFQSFPLEPTMEFATKTRHRLHSAYLLLKEMKNEWPMASRWLENICSLQQYHASRLQKNKLSAQELRSFRNLMVDYGALHDIPISDPTIVSVRSTGTTPDTNSEPSACRDLAPRRQQQHHHHHHHHSQLQDTPQSARTESSSDSSLGDMLNVLGDFDSVDYLVSEEEMAGIFQEFWTLFPGEVGADMAFQGPYARLAGA